MDNEESKVYNETLKRLKNPSYDQIRMLGAYARCMGDAQRNRKHKSKARVYKGAAIYARNGLGLWPPLFVDYMDLLLDEGLAGIIVTDRLDQSWQIERPDDYMISSYNY